MKILSDRMVDVTTLGAKTDGSEDISDIVNRATEEHELYFPAGLYKVTKSLRIKRPIVGGGYSRDWNTGSGTWFVSDINAADSERGVIEFAGTVPLRIENLNIIVGDGYECGIVIKPEQRVCNMLVSRVGIYNLRGVGINVHSRGSRNFFAQDITVFGAKGWPEGSTGMCIRGVCDSRLSNIEIMGAQISLDMQAGHTYGNNMHLWTGVMGGKDNGKWWLGTRALLLGGGTIFHGSEIYPDTAYHAIEFTGGNSSCSINNIMYWDDGTEKESERFDGTFIVNSDPDNKCVIQGGLVEVSMGTAQLRAQMPCADIRDVIVKTDLDITPENFERITFTTNLPDYPVVYDKAGSCKVADIFALAETGTCRGIFSLDDGAEWHVGVIKSKTGGIVTDIKPLNSLCARRKVTAKQDGDVVSVVFNGKKGGFSGRFRTIAMGPRFRPVDYGSLRTLGGAVRYR